MKYPILILALSLTGCTALSKIVVPPPSYNGQCEPSDERWVEWAEDTSHLAKEIPSDPQAAYDAALEEIDRLGLKLVPKSEVGSTSWNGFTTTFPSMILLAPDWEQRTLEAKAAILWHELVHKRQWDDIGQDVMTFRYAVAEGRWGLEVEAYRESFRVLRLFGYTKEQLEPLYERRLESLWSSYFLGSMPDCMKATTLEIWKRDAA